MAKTAKTKGRGAGAKRAQPAKKKNGAADVVTFRNRVCGLRTVKASELRANPKNFREHPEAQREVMTGLLAELGMVNALIARETPAGLELLDGHLRHELAPDAELPVLIVDIDDQEVDKVLATIDPVSAMATTNAVKHRALLDAVETNNANVRRFLADAQHRLPAEKPEADPAAPYAGVTEEDSARDVEGMSLEAHEHYDYLVILATTAHQWNTLLDRLGLEPVQRRGRMATARAVKADRLLELIADADAKRLAAD